MCKCVRESKQMCYDFISRPFKFQPGDGMKQFFLVHLISDHLLSIFHTSSKVALKNKELTLLCFRENFCLDAVGHTHDIRDSRLSSQGCVHYPQETFISDVNNTGLYNERHHVFLPDHCCSP